MKVLTSRLSYLLKLHICLVIYGFLILFSLRECCARVVVQDNSGKGVEEINENLKSSVIEASRINDGLQSDDGIDYVINEKSLRRIVENPGKFHKGNNDEKIKGDILSHNIEMNKNNQNDEQIERNLKELQHKQILSVERKEFKRLIKKPITRLKRSNQNVSNQTIKIIQGSSKSTENPKPKSVEYLEQNSRLDIEGIRRLDIDIEETDKKENHVLEKINTKTSISEDIDKSAKISSKNSEIPSRLSEDKISEINDYIQKNKMISVDEVKRLGINTQQENERINHDLLKDNTKNTTIKVIYKPTEMNSKILHKVRITNEDNSEHSRSQNVRSESSNIDLKSRAGFSMKSVIAENSNIKNINHMSDFIHHSAIISDIESERKISQAIQSSSKKLENEDQNIHIPYIRAEALSNLYNLKSQALELQVKIRNNTFLQYLKKQIPEILPDIPKFTENKFLEILKNILSTRNKYEFSDFDTIKDNALSDKQIEIIKYAQQLVGQKDRQSFFYNISECIRGLNVINCMRIFIYPLIVENMPEALVQELPNFPIEINVPDLLQDNNDKSKSARQIPIINFYSNSVDPDAIIFEILMEGLFKNPPNENLSSYINAKNESLSKILTCNKLHLLEMTEKFLPESERQGYSDEMLSCITRFEYFSCIKYFSWPAIKQYYTALPQFPLSDAYLSSLIYPNYPLITFPGFENGFGHLPEIIESGPARIKPELIFMQIFKKTLKEYSRIATPPTPIQLDLIVKSQFITQEQIASIHLAEQLLPVNLRAQYVSKTVQCIRQFDYYNCMKYTTWPLVRQFNPLFPNFPNFEDFANNFQFSEIPQLSNFFHYISEFQLPQFQFPQFQIPQFQTPQFQPPDILTFAPPDFSTFFPFGQQIQNTPLLAEPPITDTSSGDNKKNNTALESKIYKILKNVRDSLGATPLSLPTYTNRKVFLFPLMTEDQSKIFALAEGIVPPIAREPLITSIYFCLNEKNEFSTCTKMIIWPFIRNYVKGLPEFPAEDDNFHASKKVGMNIPITGSGDNFFIMREIENFFFEGREDAISYIIRLIQLYKSESLNMQKVLEILRSIQFNTPEFLNMQTIQYPRDPEFSTILTECQENIVHGVKSIIPEQIRQKFYNDMLECASKNKFAICSRNIIFPSIYKYFQKALSVPYYNIVSEKKNYSKISIPEISIINTIPIETKVNTERQGENLITTTDRKFMPIFPLNPELVIFGMLRKVQISAAYLPDFPKESIVNTAEFKQAFSIRQIHILAVAEGILPEEYRKGILEKMYKCNQRDSFLNCTRDIVFPAMFKAYPNFPAFPDFEKDLSQLNMISIIENLNKSSSSPRSYDSKRTLPYIEILYKFISDNRTDILRTLVDKLPDSLYYDLYIKMSQCTQFSDVISCGHDIIYPTLKYYYQVSGFNIDNYYPITMRSPFYSTVANQHSLFDYEIICENMDFICTLKPLGQLLKNGILTLNLSSSNYEAFIPFGKLADGSRIFKHNQDIWNPNIIPSVGADKSSLYKYTSQPTTMNIKSMEKWHNFFQIKKKNQYNFPLRIRRNVDDLFDSYSDAIPIHKKNSVRRRIPPKVIFPNITEIELLQILVDILNLKKNRSLVNVDVTSNNEFVDFFNDTEKTSITTSQYEILKLVQQLNSETVKAGFISRLVQCIRSLSFLRCVEIFVWPIISSNLPLLSFVSSTIRHERFLAEEFQIKEFFGITSSEFEAELMNRKDKIESNFIQWYKTLSKEKFNKNIGSLKVKGDGCGELLITFSNFREGRMSKTKDNKNLPSILTIISDVIEEVFDTKLNKIKRKNENLRKGKKDLSLNGFQETNFENHLRSFNQQGNIKRSVTDDRIINIPLERLRPTMKKIEDEDMKYYLTFEDVYRAFQVFFGPKIIEGITNQLESFDSKDIMNFDSSYSEKKSSDKLKLAIFQVPKNCFAKQLNVPLLNNRAIYGFENKNDRIDSYEKKSISLEKLFKLKTYVAHNVNKNLNTINKRKMQTEIAVQLPRLNDNIRSRKMINLNDIGRGLKIKMNQMIPAAGFAVSFIVQLVLTHFKAAASVAGLISNMALGAAIFSMIRDILLGPNNEPKSKYNYDIEKFDTGISWPQINSDSPIKYTPTKIIQETPLQFDEPY